MKYQQMTRKTKEKYAAFLLKLSYGLSMGFILTITIAPMGTILTNMAAGESGSTGWFAISNAIASWQGIIFVFLEILVAYLSLYARKSAFETYNELYPDDDSNQAKNSQDERQGSQPWLTQA